MPIHTGKDSKGPFYQWGHQKKYHYKAGNKKSMAAAKSKAKKQMKAIFSSGYIGESNQNQYQNYKFKYFGNCINTVDVDHMWDATQMQQFVDSCKQIPLNDVINNIQSGARKIPTKLLKHIQTNPQEIDVAIDDWKQNIMFIYDYIDDIHYFFDVKKNGNIYQSKFNKLFNTIMQQIKNDTM